MAVVQICFLNPYMNGPIETQKSRECLKKWRYTVDSSQVPMYQLIPIFHPEEFTWGKDTRD